MQKLVLLIVKGHNTACFSVCNSSQHQTLCQKTCETLHAVSNSWATSPLDRFFKSLLVKRQLHARTIQFFQNLVVYNPSAFWKDQLCLASRSHAQPSVTNPVRPKGSEMSHLTSATLEKPGQLLLMGKRPFTKPSIYKESQMLTFFARLQLLQLCMCSALL